MPALNRRQLILLALVTLVWGINWPIMKFGVTGYPPLTFRTLCMWLGLPLLGAFVLWRREPLRIGREHWREFGVLTVFNMLIWHTLAILAVQSLSSGRAAILGYTMPVFSAVIGALFLSQRLSAPTPPQSTLTLSFWMTVVATVWMTALAVLFERQYWHWPTAGQWASILYNAVGVFAFAQAAWLMLARELPPVASTLSVMFIPVLGVFSGAWWLGETLHWQDWAAVGLVMVSIGSVLLPSRAGR